jgi:23S rRNA (cytidine1920-2'-O)/16S rRNA (cytidine1409-2'-O)-methyltransferase
MTEKKERIDVLMTQRGLADSRSQAQRLIMAGQVRVDGNVALKPADKVSANADINLEQGPKFVSRGGEKLEGAFEAFEIGSLDGEVCADVGASTGGFTDCLLQHGAPKVFAIDVGYGVLHWKLRNDPRVVSMERTNARHLEKLAEPVSFVTIDASFISLKIFFPVIKDWFGPDGGQLVALIKPQFEAGKQDAARGEGVIRDHQVHRKVLEEVVLAAQAEGYEVRGLTKSPLLGPKGNIEFLAHMVYPCKQQTDFKAMIEAIFKSIGETESVLK